MTELSKNALALPLAFTDGNSCTLTASVKGDQGLTLAVLDVHGPQSKVLCATSTEPGQQTAKLIVSTEMADGLEGGSPAEIAMGRAADLLSNEKTLARYFVVLSPGQVAPQELNTVIEFCKSKDGNPLSNLPSGSSLKVEGAATLSVRDGYPWCLEDPMERMAWGGYKPATDLTSLLLVCDLVNHGNVGLVTIVCDTYTTTVSPTWVQGSYASTAWIENLDLGNSNIQRIECWWGTIGNNKGISFIPEIVGPNTTHTAVFPSPLGFKIDITHSSGAFTFGNQVSYSGDGVQSNTDALTACLVESSSRTANPESPAEPVPTSPAPADDPFFLTCQ